MNDTDAAARDDSEAPDGAAPAWIRSAPSLERMDEWVLVLAATGIPNRVDRQIDGGYVLGVAPQNVTAAERALRAYDIESQSAARVAPAAPDRGSNALGIGVALALIGFVFVTGYWETEPASRWFAAGVADASRIRAGEWWRAITAMTLHADVMHLLGNVAASVIFISAAGRWLGAGVGAAAILLAGTGANVLTAWVERSDHFSVGASTATFAGLGLVVGLQVVRRWRGGGAIRRRAWVAAGAGFALLAMLGMGAKADVFAHAFGLGLGTLLGIVAGIVDHPTAEVAGGAAGRRGTLVAWLTQSALVLGTAAAVAAAWAHALAHG
ncbi:MAG TPA: rhomboid family intramembrane serine protease [Polyangia bacterium]